MERATKKYRQKSLMDRPPTDEEIKSAANAATAIAYAMGSDGGLKVSGKNGYSIKLAPAVGNLIIELLGHVSKGNMVTLVPVSTMLTTQEAANILNVSRPFLTGLLKKGEIPFVKVGRHRRVSFKDLMEYKENKERQQKEALRELAHLGQEYDKA